MAYRQTPEMLERRRAVRAAWAAWEEVAPKHVCGQPALPAGPGRARYLGGIHPRHLWCHGGHDWLEKDPAFYERARVAWQACAAIVLAEAEGGA